VLTGVLHVLGHPWLSWHRVDQLRAIPLVSAFSSMLLGPAIVRRYPKAFQAPDRPRPPAGPPSTTEQLAAIPWPSAGEVQRARQRARRWALARVSAAVVPVALAVAAFAAALADLIPLPDSERGIWAVVVGWAALVSVGVHAGFSCTRTTLRAVAPGRAMPAKVSGVVPEHAGCSTPGADAAGRSARCGPRRATGHVVEMTVLDDDLRPVPGDVVVLVGRVPRHGGAGPTGRRAASRALTAVVVVGGRPRDPVLPPRLVHVPSAGPATNRLPSASGEARA
jgi:hypothetical protein